MVIDGDGHKIVDYESHRIINNSRPIIMGNHVWIGANSKVLKGTSIKNSTVIAADSIVNKTFDESNVIVAGKPATIVKRNTTWIR